MVTLLVGTPMVDWNDHVDMAVEDSNFVTVIKLAGLIVTGGSYL